MTSRVLARRRVNALVFRSLKRNELDYEWIFGPLAALGLACAWLYPLWSRVVVLPCVFRSITGAPCVTCGATRAASAWAHGEWLGSFAWNPLGGAIALLASLYAIYAFVVLVSGRRRVRLTGECGALPERSSLVWRAGTLLILLANWAYLIGVGQ